MTVDEAVAAPGAAHARASTSSADWDVGRSPGSLIVAWQHPVTRLISPVGLLEHGAGYRYRYLRRAPHVEGFLPFLGFPSWHQTYIADRLFPLFQQRIMSPRRPDFRQFLRQLDLSDNASPWEQLARSEGRRTGDTVQVFPIPCVEADGFSTCRFLVHGIRHVNGGRLPLLSRGELLTLRDNKENPVNSDAVLVCSSSRQPLGYVPDLLLDHLRVLKETEPPHLVVEHVNGPDAPAHLRLLVRLDGLAPAGYEPMSGPQWETF
jgi:hypothetical protein